MNKPIAYIIRGLPGSGKSTLAKKLVHVSRWTENDQFRYNDQGCYVYDKLETKYCRDACFNRFKFLVDNSYSDVAVSNVFFRVKYFKHYIKYAKKKGYDIMVIECHGDFGCIHNIPEKSLEYMKTEWEQYKHGF